jgi:hypothetical protein
MATYTALGTALACALRLAPPTSFDGVAHAVTTEASASGEAASIEGPAPAPTPPASEPATPASPPPPDLPATARADMGEISLPEDPCRREGRDTCRDKRISGAVLTGVGAAGVVIGISLVAVPNQPVEGRPTLERQFQPTGVLLLGGAVVFLAAGVFFIAEAIQTERGERTRAGRRTR